MENFKVVYKTPEGRLYKTITSRSNIRTDHFGNMRFVDGYSLGVEIITAKPTKKRRHKNYCNIPIK